MSGTRPSQRALTSDRRAPAQQSRQALRAEGCEEFSSSSVEFSSSSVCQRSALAAAFDSIVLVIKLLQ